MVSIDTYNACVDFPIFDAKSRSLKKAMMASAGGKIGKNASNTVVVEALRDINLHLREGDRVGLVGHNGAGKSTLLRLLSGIYEPTRGSAVVRGRVAPVFDLGVGMDPEISGYENIIIRGLFLGQTRKQMKAKMDEIAEFSELGDVLAGLGAFVGGNHVRDQAGLADLSLVHPKGGVAELRQEVVRVRRKDQDARSFHHLGKADPGFGHEGGVDRADPFVEKQNFGLDGGDNPEG